jgi:ElaB/YqjD/DUF883 family membrane-anchored ribosome-binding protein
MPNQQRQGQPQGRQNGGAAQAATEAAQNLGQRIQEGASQVGERIQEGYGAAREGLSHGYRRAEGAVARHPGQSVLVGFGVGFGLGVLLTVLLTRREEESWYDRYVPDRLRHLHMPHLPESIARHMPGH